MEKIGVFSVCDESYLPKAIVALCSIRDHNSDFDYFVFGDIRTKRMLRLISGYEIKFVRIDYSDVFSRKEGKWKSECFWIFAVPEILANMGYDYSCAVDGDVLCKRKLDVDWIASMKHIAGIKNYKVQEDIPPDQREWAFENLDISNDDLDVWTTNTGAVWFNDKNLKKFSFFEKCKKIYVQCEGKIPMDGDQQLLAMLAPRLDWVYLNPNWNFRLNRDNPYYMPNNPSRNNPYLIHFVASKPWDRSLLWDGFHAEAGFKNEITRLSYINEWREYARTLFGKGRYGRLFWKDYFPIVRTIRKTFDSH